MSDFRNTVSLDDVEVVRETEKALLVLVEGDERWVPKSQIDDASEVYKKGTSGTLVINEWFATKENWPW